jgi:hypothetical protein
MSDFNWAAASNGGSVTGINSFGTGVGTDYDITWIIGDRIAGSYYDGVAQHAYADLVASNEAIIQLASTQSISKVVCWFNEADGRSTDPGDADTLGALSFAPEDFTIETWNGSGWDNRATVTGNTLIKRTFTFGPVSTDQVRFVCTAAHGHTSFFVQEIEVIEAVTNSVAFSGTGVAAFSGATPAGVVGFHGSGTLNIRSNHVAGALSGAGQFAAAGCVAVTGTVSFAGVGKARCHTPYNLNYHAGEYGTATAGFGIPPATSVPAPHPEYANNGDTTSVGGAVLISEGIYSSYIQIGFSSPKWIAGVRIYSSGGSGGTTFAHPIEIRANDVLEDSNPYGEEPTYVLPTATGTNTIIFDDLVFAKDIVATFSPGAAEPFPTKVFEFQVIGIGQVYNTTEVSTADATDAAIAGHTNAWISTANAVATQASLLATTQTSAANATATDASKKKHTDTLVSYAAETDELKGVRVAVETSSAAASNEFISVIPVTLVSEAAAQATLVAKITHAEVSSADATAETTPGRVLSVTEVSTADASTDAVGIRRVIATEVSTADAAEVNASKGIFSLSLQSNAAVSDTLLTQSKIHATEVSEADASATIRLPQTAYPGFWSNTRNMAAARWEGAPFNSVIELDGSFYGADGVGIRRLLPKADDLTAPIEAEIEWDLSNFGSTKKKRLRSAYIDAQADGPFRFRVVCEQGGFDYQTHLASADVTTNHRAPLGKGFNSAYYRFGLLQDNYFSLSGLLVNMGDTTRRI